MKQVTKIGAVEVLEVPAGPLDAGTAPALREALVRRCVAARKVVLDLKGVTFVDSSGLGAILGGFRAMREKGGDLKLCGPARPVRILFELLRLDRVMEIHPTREAAVASFRS